MKLPIRDKILAELPNRNGHFAPLTARGRRLPEPGHKDNEVTVRVGPMVNLAALIYSLGRDPQPIFGRAGFTVEEFQNPDHRIGYQKTSRLLAGCVEATGCDHLGLLLGMRAEPSHLGLAGFLVRAAPTVERALQALVENLDLHDDGGTSTLRIERDYTTLSYQIHLPGVAASSQIYDLSAAVIYRTMQVLCGPDWTASSVELERREPEKVALYRRFFRTTLYFNSTHSVVTFASSYLVKSTTTADKLLFSHLEEEAQLLHNLHRHDLMEAFPAALVRGLLTEQFSAGAIADRFGIHERTLHRRLRDAGTSFRHELDRARRSVSEQLLGTTSLSVGEVASALGYADSSGFIRAFQRWCGTSPSAWRRRNGFLAKSRTAADMAARKTRNQLGENPRSILRKTPND
jgi:AraC-like DNA-binding protein